MVLVKVAVGYALVFGLLSLIEPPDCLALNKWQ